MSQDFLSGIWSARNAPSLTGREWELLLAQAKASRLMARLAELYTRRGWNESVPAGPARHLESARRIGDRLHHEVGGEINHILDALRPLPTPIVLLKGAAYLAAGLPPAKGRLFSDVDVLVRRDQLERVENALFAAGWIPEKLKPYDDRYYRTWMHELPPLQHVRRRTFLDVHHTIAPPTSRFAIDGARLFEHVVPLADEPRLSVLAPVDMVLHSAVHLLQDGDFSGGLRDLLDLNDLLIHFGQTADFWPELFARAVELGIGTSLHHALFHVDRLFGTQCPEAFESRRHALAPDTPSRRLMTTLLVVALRPDHPSCDGPATGACRKLLFIRSHWLRMPWYQIGPHLLRKAFARAMARMQPDAAPAAPPV